MSQMQVKMRQGGQLKDIPFGCSCDGSGGGMDNGELAAVQKELEALGGNIAAVQADLKATQDEQTLIRQELERRGKAVENIYVGGSGASDTLVDGRGLVPELPFETLNMALYYSNGKDLARYRNYWIQGDIEDDVLTSGFNNGFAINLRRGSNLQNNPKVVLKNSLSLNHGYLSISGVDFERADGGDVIQVGAQGGMTISNSKIKGVTSLITVANGGYGAFYDISFELDNGAQILYATNFGNIALSGSITMNGQCSIASILVARAARVLMSSPTVNFSGEVVGKKHHLVSYAALILNGNSRDNIPGTQAGICDTSSAVIA